MSTISHVHVRALEIADFDFVQLVASQQSTFTVPPKYILWLLLRIKGAVCLVAEHSTSGPMAYLLAVPMQSAEESLFVWQLASIDSGKDKAILALLAEFRGIVTKRAVRTIVFTSVPNSVNYRAIRRYASKVFSSSPQQTGTLPAAVSRSEGEFLLSL
jgi:hypothetical protein